ncbi:hypothetical protein Zmor_003038 [Zophobas morio]|uniref:Uncharacterized protein n=1 Tax=Zophobas morio TaxID=2755281 RepID=A0AA38HLW1_9CUCU|nr:hypothetical protein Zmor_003038 [Zophobas morio]
MPKTLPTALAKPLQLIFVRDPGPNRRPGSPSSSGKDKHNKRCPTLRIRAPLKQLCNTLWRIFKIFRKKRPSGSLMITVKTALHMSYLNRSNEVL